MPTSKFVESSGLLKLIVVSRDGVLWVYVCSVWRGLGFIAANTLECHIGGVQVIYTQYRSGIKDPTQPTSKF